jgi:predicted O-methyltransferase YrrM
MGRYGGETGTMGIANDIDQFYANPNYPTLLLPSENLFLYALVVAFRPRLVLEIGTWRGGSANVIVKALDEVARLVPLVARWQTELGGEGEIRQVESDTAESRLVCVDPNPNLQIDWSAIAHRATLVQAPSPAALPEAHDRAGGNFDLCFIDGGHHYLQVLADTFGVLPYMAPGSLLLYHDAFYPEVKRAVDEAVATAVGLTDCGIVGRFKLFDYKGAVGPKDVAWDGLRLVRVGRNPGSDPGGGWSLH